MAESRFEIELRTFTDENLAWDAHCNIGEDSLKLILAEARRRKINLCSIIQIRGGGPFVRGMKWYREMCGNDCFSEHLAAER